MQTLILVAESNIEDGPIAVLKALNRHRVREFIRDRKEHHWGKWTLKRDQ
jgi:hypothetical protein